MSLSLPALGMTFFHVFTRDLCAVLAVSYFRRAGFCVAVVLLCNPGFAFLVAGTPGDPEESGQPAPTLCWVLCGWQVGPKQLKPEQMDPSDGPSGGMGTANQSCHG